MMHLKQICMICWYLLVQVSEEEFKAFSYQLLWIMHYSEDTQSFLYMHFIAQFVFSPEMLISSISDKLQGDNGFILEEWKRQKNFLYIFAPQTHT